MYIKTVRRQKKQVCGSEGTVEGWAGTLLLGALAIIIFFYQLVFNVALSFLLLLVPNNIEFYQLFLSKATVHIVQFFDSNSMHYPTVKRQ
jgi:hypothetical protein